MISRKILVVDDDSTSRRLMSHILNREGYDVAAASDGVEALELMADDPAEILITDRMMPNMDGVELLRAVRQSPIYGHIPVIIVTANSDARDQPEAEAAGATAFLTKPVGSTELLATVQRALLLGQVKKSA
jgi:two-component system chemotaxis response regulator CheY